MPDLREDLGRLADFVGEPGSLRDLEVARRRRERRRRAGGLVAGLTVLIAVVALAISVLRTSPEAFIPNDSTSGSTPAPASAGPPTVWPENPISEASAQDVQASVDAGDQTFLWRTDPKQVVEHFGREILGRSMANVTVTPQDGQLLVQASPCPAGERAGGTGCDVLGADQLSLTLVQPAGQGDGGIWSVAAVRSQPLSILQMTGLATSVAAGERVDFDLSGFGRSATGHIGILVSNGCRAATWSSDVAEEGPRSLVVPQLDPGDPSCLTSGTGYVFAYVTDDTTQPLSDPINEPTAIEDPWITIYPVSVVNADQGSVPSPSLTESGCSTPRSSVTIIEAGLQLRGCTIWEAGHRIDLTFDARDDGVAMGLELFPLSACQRAGGCTGDPLFIGELVTGPRTITYIVPALESGDYVLRDAVHPNTDLEITVGPGGSEAP